MRKRARKKRATGAHIKARRTFFDGQWWDSKGEAQRWADLKLMQRAGLIRDLEAKPTYKFFCEHRNRGALKFSKGYPNGRTTVHVADFRYFDVERDREVVEDYKGDIDDDHGRTKRAVVYMLYGIRIELYPPEK